MRTSFFESWMALNSELFSYLTCPLIDTFKYIVQLLRPLWGVVALLCGVANLSISFELHGAPLCDSRVDLIRAKLVGPECSYRLSFDSSRGYVGAPATLPTTTSLVLAYFADSVEWKQDGVLEKYQPQVGRCSLQIFSCLNLKIIFSLGT